jgi:D-lyxose ketol-isomerase
LKIKNIDPPSHWQTLTYHPFSELTEIGVGIDIEAMIDHMAKNGWDPSERITLYCGKILEIQKGKRCSLHFHKLKTESFYLRAGRLKVRVQESPASDMLLREPS